MGGLFGRRRSPLLVYYLLSLFASVYCVSVSVSCDGLLVSVVRLSVSLSVCARQSLRRFFSHPLYLYHLPSTLPHLHLFFLQRPPSGLGDSQFDWSSVADVMERLGRDLGQRHVPRRRVVQSAVGGVDVGADRRRGRHVHRRRVSTAGAPRQVRRTVIGRHPARPSDRRTDHRRWTWSKAERCPDGGVVSSWFIVTVQKQCRLAIKPHILE